MIINKFYVIIVLFNIKKGICCFDSNKDWHYILHILVFLLHHSLLHNLWIISDLHKWPILSNLLYLFGW